MVLASSAAAAAPAYALPSPLALCSISAKADACACETLPAKMPATASDRTDLLMRVMTPPYSVLSKTESCRPFSFCQHHSTTSSPGKWVPRLPASGESHSGELAFADLEYHGVALPDGQSFVCDLFPVDAHAALLDHPQGL